MQKKREGISERPKRKRLIGTGCAAAAVLIGAGAALILWKGLPGTPEEKTTDSGMYAEAGDDETVMTVNGLRVTGAEYRFFEDQEAGAVSSYFSTEYGADTGEKDFWDTEYGGETPGQRLKDMTEKEIVYSKTVQSLAGEYGLEFPEDFTELEQERREENEQRAAEVSEGGTVYGPIEYGEYEYYSYRFGNLEEELKQKLRENVFTFSDEELKAAYDGMGEGYFDRGYRGEARVYVTVRTESAEEAGGQSSETLRVLFDEIREQLLSGKTPDADAVSEKYGIRVNMYEYSFEGDSAFKDNDQMQQVMEIYGQLAPGEVSGMYNVMGYDCIVQCISKEDLGVSTWEENREFLIRHCLEEKYEKYMEEQCREAEIAR